MVVMQKMDFYFCSTDSHFLCVDVFTSSLGLLSSQSVQLTGYAMSSGENEFPFKNRLCTPSITSALRGAIFDV